jgi:hypothetical protein
MDWARARLILLVAFTAVNLSLSYFIWGVDGTSGLTASRDSRQQLDKLRVDLAQRDVHLAPSVTIPPTPEPMSFLRVVHRPVSPTAVQNPEGASLLVDPHTGVLTFRPSARGQAAREIKLENRAQVQQVALEYTRSTNLLPAEAQFLGLYPQPRTGFLRAEYAPTFGGLPIFSGYVWVDISPRGIETITRFWVEPEGLKEGSAKAVRPASEAILRVADLLAKGDGERVITGVRLGYYAGPAIAGSLSSLIRAWDVVPVWQIRVGDSRIYYVNAFNGQIEN